MCSVRPAGATTAAGKPAGSFARRSFAGMMGKKKRTAAERLTHLKKLLETERDEDFRLYREQFLRVNLEQRRKNGVTWHPLKILSHEIGAGELLHLEIERTTHTDRPHHFSAGKNASLFTTTDENADEITGTIKS